ncbi:hypothetical protein GHT07_17135 [Caenimonas koreensis DSM 17982]|uniref:Uncharacterized protein n=1 Tax=Caenimonas koreensis DSM 17982 TaxID=1121255 RepID=A0A844AY91_9BURK|nr:hypothetical protein [Caenimonas koreensis]MRD49004.1 hypothetical protein [Caenimonas koreensis DSM 17982]
MPRPSLLRRAPARRFHFAPPRAQTGPPTSTPSSLRRGYQSLPSLHDKAFADVVFHLDTTRAGVLLQHPEPQELLADLQLCGRHMQSDPLAWQEAVRHIDRAMQSRQLSQQGSLALVMQTMRAARAFTGEMATPAFVSLLANMQPLDGLVLGTQQQDRIASFASAAVQLAAECLPSGGAAFFAMPTKRRIELFARFLEKLVDAACEMEMGIHEDDRELFVVEATGESRFAGRFDVLADSPDWPATARFSLGGPIGATDACSQPAEANSHFAMLIEVAVHEVIHACQNSLVDRSSFACDRSFSSDAQYHEALAALLGSCIADWASWVESGTQADAVPRTIWLPLPERPAWFSSWMARESLAKCGFFDVELRNVARMTHPMEREAIARLVGIRPRGAVTVSEDEQSAVRIVTEPFRFLDSQEDAALDARGHALSG